MGAQRGKCRWTVDLPCFSGLFWVFLNIALTVLPGVLKYLAVQREAYIQFHGSLRCNPVRLKPLYFTTGNLSLENNRSRNTRSETQSSCTKQLQDYRGLIPVPPHRSCAGTRPAPSGRVGLRNPGWWFVLGHIKFTADKTLSSCLLALTPPLLCTFCSPWERAEAAHLLFQAADRMGKHTSLFLVQTLMSVKSKQLKPHFPLSAISGTVFCIYLSSFV